MGKLQSEEENERRRERSEGLNPEEVVEDDAMDWEWEKGNERFGGRANEKSLGRDG